MFVTDDKIPIPVARYYVHSDIELRIPSDGGGGGVGVAVRGEARKDGMGGKGSL